MSEAEHGRIEANAEGEDEDGGGRKARRAWEEPQGDIEVVHVGLDDRRAEEFQDAATWLGRAKMEPWTH